MHRELAFDAPAGRLPMEKAFRRRAHFRVKDKHFPGNLNPRTEFSVRGFVRRNQEDLGTLPRLVRSRTELGLNRLRSVNWLG